jgi:hypothetical protein
MRRLASCLLAVLAALAIASCSQDVPSQRYECTCVNTNLQTDNSRTYTFCESDGSSVNGDATTQCEKDFAIETGCDCTCDHSGSCSL